MSEKAQNIRLVLAYVMTQALSTHSVCHVGEVYFGFTDRLFDRTLLSFPRLS